MKRLCTIFFLFFILQFSLYATGIEYLTPELIDLGRSFEGIVLDGEIRFVNSREDSVKIENVRTSCGCTVAGYDVNKIAPGDTSDIRFSLKTRGFNGVVRKTITVQFDSEFIPPRIFTIQANIYKEVDVSPRFIRFSNIKVNPDTVINHLVTIENNSMNTIRINGAECDSDLIRPVLQSTTVSKGKRTIIKLELRPKRVANQHAYITISLSSKSKPTIKIPVFYEIEE